MRIQLVVTDAQQTMIETLREQTGVKTVKEVFNNALTLLNWAVRQRQEGSAICAVNEEKNVYKELQLPVLDFCTYQTPKLVSAQTAEAEHISVEPLTQQHGSGLASEAGQRAASEAVTIAKGAAAGQGRQLP
jgi:hypothetical protein